MHIIVIMEAISGISGQTKQCFSLVSEVTGIQLRKIGLLFAWNTVLQMLDVLDIKLHAPHILLGVTFDA